MLELMLQGIRNLKALGTPDAQAVLDMMYVEVTTLPYWKDHPSEQAVVLAALTK